MWSFYYRPTKQKAYRCQNELFGQSNVPCSSVMLKFFCLQSLLLLLFCLDCSCAPTQSPTLATLSYSESLHARPLLLVLKRIFNAPESRHSLSPITIWKLKELQRELKTLKKPSMSEEQNLSVTARKLYKWSRLFKRDLENVNQKNQTLSELASTFTEILRKILGQDTLSLLPGLENARSVGSSNTESLANFPGEFSRIGLMNDNTLDNLLMTPSSETISHSDLSDMKTPTFQIDSLLKQQTLVPNGGPVSEMKTQSSEDQMMLTLKQTSFANPEDVHSIGSLNKQEQATTPDLKLFLVQPVSTIPTTKQGFPYSNGKPITKLKYMNPSNIPFPNTDGTEVLAKIANQKSTTFTNSDYTNNGLKELPYSDLTTVEHYSVLYKQTTDRSNLLDMSVDSKPETSTLGNVLQSSLEPSTINLQHGDVTVTKISPVKANFASSAMSVNTKLYRNSNPPLSTQISPDADTTFYLKENNWNLVSVTPLTLDIVGLSSTKREIETKTLLNTDHNTVDLSQMTTPRTGTYSLVDDSPGGIFFSSTMLDVQVGEDFTSAPATVHTSKTDQTAKHDTSLDYQSGTLRAFSTSSLPSQAMSTVTVSHSTDLTDSNTLSSVTPSSYHVKGRGCVLQIHDLATTLMPISETISLPTVSKPSDYESQSTEVSTSSSVTPNDRSTLVESTFTDVYSELGFQSTMTTPSFEDEVFNDMMNGNDNINQSTFNTTSTLSSTQVDNVLTTLTSPWKSKTSQHFSSTVESVLKTQTSQSKLFSTDSKKVFPDANATQDHTQSNLQLSSLSSPTGSRASNYPTTMPAALHRTISRKSMADLESSSIKTSTYNPSTKKYLVSSSIKTSTYNPSTKKYLVSSSIKTSTYNPSTKKYLESSSIKTSTYNPSTKKYLESSSIKTSTDNPLTKKYLANKVFSTRDLLTTKHTTIGPREQRTTSNTKDLLISLTPTSRLKSSEKTWSVVPKEWAPQTIFPLTSTIATSITYNTRQKFTSALTTTTPVVTMPLNFHLVGVLFTKQLTNHTSKEYRTLEKEVKLVMDKILFAKYQNDYYGTEIQAFLNGSVIVKSNVLFQSDLSAPSESDVVRTVLTDGTKRNYFGWSINGSSVDLNGYTQSNLDLEALPISLLVLRAGYIAISPKNQDKKSFLDNLQKAMFHAVNASFPITNISISQIRDVFGDLEVRGILYLNSTVHTNVHSLMSSLLPLVNRSVDLSSIVVNGIHNELKVHSINFRITNKQFVLNLLDMASSESQLLSKDLAAVVQSVLRDSNPLQVMIREFKSGSVVCRGDLVYQIPAPNSDEVLRLLLKTLGSDGILGSSTYKVDLKSLTIGDSSPGPSNEYLDFPGFGVAIIVMCGLCILIFPIILFVCNKTRMLGHRKKATIQRQQREHEADDQSHHFEMDNRAFRASIEQL